MGPFWLIDEALLAGVRAAQRGAGAAQPARSATGASFVTQIERMLGEDTEPDAEFFVDSWTVGVAEASDNFLRRTSSRKSREQQDPAWSPFSSYTPFFVSGEEAPVETAQPIRDSRSGEASLTGQRWQYDVKRDDRFFSDDSETAGSLTVESARRILGVTSLSTREQIRAAYRRMASQYHPDRLANAGLREQKLASDRMASINEAYRLLCEGLVGQWSPCFG